MIYPLNLYKLHVQTLEAISTMNNAIVSSESIFSLAIRDALWGIPPNPPIHLLENAVLVKHLTDREFEMFEEDRTTLVQIYNNVYTTVKDNYFKELDLLCENQRQRVVSMSVQHGLVMFDIRENVNG